ncbi:MAG: multidrug effflux MFS transporter [Phyllobacteriaceae bacterium]|nr:multidrug effflux MFS transporter [Phyllobacteriaceae bacterium]
MMVALGPVSMAVYTPAMPDIVSAFATTEAAVKTTLTVYFAGFAFAQLFCGPLSDAVGRRPVTLGFIGLYLAASALGAFAPDIEWLIAARFLQGVGAAVGVVIARAMVRDLFAEESGARIMNLTGIILAVAPAIAPTLGGIVLGAAGWHAIFWLMVGYGLLALATVAAMLPETVERDLSRLQPMAVAASYAELLAAPQFLFAALALGGAVGALYAQATILPFLLMDRIGLTPTQFGLSMLMQSGAFFLGSLTARPMMRRHGAGGIVVPGLALIGAGSVALALGLTLFAPRFLSVMLPVASYAVGIAWVMPALTTQALRPFAHMAGSASSMMGFLQMGLGLAGGALSAFVGDPALSMATIIPGLGALSILSYRLWRRGISASARSPG